jgi:ADP-ribose pyrophosphatase YjhB (NUDIX family)
MKEVIFMEVKKTHIGAYGLIINDDRIALIRKARGGYKGKLDLPGGGIEHEETPSEALVREIREEVDATVEGYYLLDVASTNIVWEMEEDLWEDLHHIGIIYRVSISESELKKDADGLDSDGASWYLINDLKRNELSPFTIYGLEKLGYKLTK